jgi:parvulin-like peptidyl-prolyl isomerase
VSDIVTTKFGYHLIKVIEKIPAKKIDFATAKDDIKELLSRRQIHKQEAAYILKLRTDLQVEILDATLKGEEAQFQAAAAAAQAAEQTGTNF